MKFILHSKFFLVVLVLLLLYIYFKVVLYSYWKKNNVLHEKPIVPLGTLSTKFVMKKINLGELSNLKIGIFYTFLNIFLHYHCNL